jgi:hypothetical protein
MNCPNCGTSLPEGTQTCPVCGVPMQNTRGQAGYARQGGGFAQGFDPTAYGAAGPQSYGQSPYAQSGGQQHGFDPTAGNPGGYAQGYDGYPSGYRQVYGRYSAPPVRGSEFLGAMSNLPRVIRGLIGDPGETLRGMMERNDRLHRRGRRGAVAVAYFSGGDPHVPQRPRGRLFGRVGADGRFTGGGRGEPEPGH